MLDNLSHDIRLLFQHQNIIKYTLMISDCWISRLAVIFHYFPAGRYLFILLARSGWVGNCWISGDQNNKTENILLRLLVPDIHLWLCCWWHLVQTVGAGPPPGLPANYWKCPGDPTEEEYFSPSPVWYQHGGTEETLSQYRIINIQLSHSMDFFIINSFIWSTDKTKSHHQDAGY